MEKRALRAKAEGVIRVPPNRPSGCQVTRHSVCLINDVMGKVEAMFDVFMRSLKWLHVHSFLSIMKYKCTTSAT